MIIVLCAKSSSGKDSLLNYIKENYDVNDVVSITTRPMRDSEQDGKEYYFVDNKTFEKYINDGDIIEYRYYKTLVDNKEDIWYYGTNKNYIDDEKNNIMILDLKGLELLKHYFNNIISIYIDVNDDIREKRAKSRGSFDQIEWDRRKKDDDIEFSDAKKICTYNITNNTTYEDLTQQLDYIFLKLQIKPSI